MHHVQHYHQQTFVNSTEKKENTTPFCINLTRSSVLYQAAQREFDTSHVTFHAESVINPWMNTPLPPQTFVHSTHVMLLSMQIVSSAIVNAPPPQTFMNLLHKTNRSDVVMKPQTREKMVRIFKGRLTGDKLLAQRWVNPLGAMDACTSLQICCCLHSPVVLLLFVVACRIAAD